MRVILDTNLLVAALISPYHPPEVIYRAWLARRYELVTSHEQLDEFRRVTRYPRVRTLIAPPVAGTMLNTLKADAQVLDRLPRVERSRDPGDNFLLAMAEASTADYLVTGDKRDLLELRQHGGTRIVTARTLIDALGLSA